MFLDIPPQLQERVICSISAAVKYDVPANIVLAVAEKEAGKPGQWVRNSNGSHDVGSMQFNTTYLRDLAKYGITAADVAKAGCYSFDLAAWRIRGHILNDKGDLWARAANYHSRTPQFNTPYRADLIIKAVKWADWLEDRFITHVVGHSGRGTERATPDPTERDKIIKAVQPVADATKPDARKISAPSPYVSRKLITYAP